MTKKLKIFTIGDNTKDEPLLKDHPYFTKNFRMILTAPSGMGKSQLLYNFMFNDEFLLKMIKKSNVNCFIPTETTCEEMAKLAKKTKLKPEKFSIKNFWDESVCEDIYNKLDKSKTNFMIFDDVSFLKQFCSTHKKTVIDSIMCAGRHKNLYTVILSQKYTHINENVRSNQCNILVFFWGLNSKELERIYIENFSFLEKSEFEDMIKQHLDKQYKFIIFNKSKNKIFDSEFNEITI